MTNAPLNIIISQVEHMVFRSLFGTLGGRGMLSNLCRTARSFSEQDRHCQEAGPEVTCAC